MSLGIVISRHLNEPIFNIIGNECTNRTIYNLPLTFLINMANVEKITDRYKFKKEIGRGAYGAVWYVHALLI